MGVTLLTTDDLRLTTPCLNCLGKGEVSIRNIDLTGKPTKGSTMITCRECQGKKMVPTELGQEILEFIEEFKRYE